MLSVRVMIAPEFDVGKGLRGLPRRRAADHGFVNGIIMLPYFGQSAAKPKRMMATVASGPVS
jgi:hypothetical protein